MAKSYAEKLKDPRWQQKRLEILERDEWKCTECGTEEEILQVHHVIYLKELEPWDYEDSFYKTLCKTCHNNRHEIIQELIFVLGDTGSGMIENLLFALRDHCRNNDVNLSTAISVAIQALKSEDLEMFKLCMTVKTLSIYENGIRRKTP